MLRQRHVRIARHSPQPHGKIAKKGKVPKPSPFSVALTAVRLEILTWFLPPLSSQRLSPELRPS